MIRNIITQIILISLSLKLVSCSNQEKDWNKKIDSVDKMFNIFSNELELSSDIYISDSIHLLNPFTIKIIDDQILIQDFGNKGGILSVYNMTSKRFIGMMLNKGKGPNEFLGFRMNLYGKDTLLALDPLKNSAQLFSISNIKTCKSTPNRVINFQTPNKGEQIDQCFFFENKLICSGQFQKGRFHVYDIRGNFIKEFDEYPKVNFDNKQIDNIQLGFIFGANVSFYKNSQMSKIACLGSCALSIYDYDKNNEEFSKVFFAQWFSPAIRDAIYKNGKPYVIRSAKNCMLGAGNIVASDRYLFFPVSSYSIADVINNGEEDNFKYIFVTNWNGIPVAKLILDKAIRFPLEIDMNGKYLYSIHTDVKTGFAQIVRFDISFLK